MFSDGSQYFFVNGRAISEQNFNAISSDAYTLDDFIKEGNEEVKSTCIALMQDLHGEESL